MLNKVLKFSFLLVFVGLLNACAGSTFYHENIMRGQVVGVDNDELVICIGREDGAKEGQELQVYRYAWEGEDYRFDYVGAVQIESVINDHFARAIGITGDVKQHDIVELKK